MNSIFESIADGIADNGYAITDQFLSHNEVSNILSEEFTDFSEFRKAGIGELQNRLFNEAIRNDHIRWIDRKTASPSVSLYLQRLNELIIFLNQNLFLSLKDYEVHMTVYPPGSYYRRHLDQFKKDDHRKLSIICYLNESWQPEDGGQLRLYLPAGSTDVLPTAGKLVCFRSDKIEHEVLPSTRDRLSITGWILDQFLELKYL